MTSDESRRPNRDVVETEVVVTPDWNIAGNPNGGYLVSLVLDRVAAVCPHPDPLSVTSHFLRPGTPDAAGLVTVEVVRSGRTTTAVRGTLSQDGRERVVVAAVFGDLGEDGEGERAPAITVAPFPLPPPEDCVVRSGFEQGVDLPLLERVEVRLHPEHPTTDADGRAITAGWARFADGTPPTTRTLPLLADVFPPSVAAIVDRVGWVPTVELTVHARRRPVPGWLRVEVHCDDLAGGRMIEDGLLWDTTGRLVARSRQLALVRTA